MKLFIKVLSYGIVIALFISLMPSALAASTGTNITITGGTSSMTALTVGNFSPVTLNGSDQIATANINSFTVVDARGNGKGWNVQVSATPLTNGTSQLHDGSITISGTIGTASGHSDSFDPSYINSSLQVKSVPANYITVPQSKGKGTYVFTSGKLTLDIWPSEALAGTYTSTVTFDLVANIN